mmetsp:Transcript_1811/g.4526  ORF Transcript_1811/g.4526 Transcript_1811/m.4526 type:complete len:463 (-) Transcript_1811:145-1533(-)
MLADSEVQVLASVGLIEASAEVSAVVNVVTGGSMKIGGSRDVVGNGLGNLLDDLVARDTGGLGLTAHLGDGLDHLGSRHDVVGNGILKLLGEVAVGFLPGSVGGLPVIVDALVLLLDAAEEVTGALGHEPLLLGEADGRAGFVNVWDTGLSVSGVGALCLLHSLSDDGVALDELGLAIVGGLGGGDGLLNNSKVMSINLVRLPTVGIVTLHDVLGLGVLGHFVEGDLVGVVKDDEVVKLLVGGEGGGLSRDTLLEATVTSKGEDVVIEDLVVVSVVTGGSHLLRNSKTDSVGDTGSEGTSGALNSGGVVFGVGELRVARGLGVVLTKLFELIDREVEASEVKPGVKEHRSVASRKDEAVTVEPLGVLGIVLHLRSVKGGTNLGASKRKTHVSRVSGGNGVHGKTTGLVGSGGEGGHLVDLSGSLGHLQGGSLTDAHGAHGGETLNTSGDGRSGNNKLGEFHD